MRRRSTWDVQQIDRMEAPPEDQYDWTRATGFRYFADGNSVGIGMNCITKPRVEFTDTQLFNLASVNERLQDGLDGRPALEHQFTRVLRSNDFRPYRSRYGYKFVTEETYDRFITEGYFRLSSLGRFRDLELQGDIAGDRFEGTAYCCFSVRDRNLVFSLISGFDSHIFSLTRDLRNANEMRERFGPVVLQVKLAPFARRLSELVGQDNVETRLVRYADLKIYRGAMTYGDAESAAYRYSSRLAKAVRRGAAMPSIFAKPSRFELEREVRIRIATGLDVPDTTDVQDRGLLRFVRRIDTSA